MSELAAGASDTSAQYQRITVRYLLGPWAPELVEAVGIRPGDRVLDVACGTGAVTRIAARVAGDPGQVTGLDILSESLAVARSHADPATGRIRWIEGDAGELPFADNRFDVVVCQQGAQFFPNRLAALGEMNRVLAGNGRLGITVWREIEHNPYYLALARALGEFVGFETEERMRSSFALSDATALKAVIEAAGFHDVRVQACRLVVAIPPVHDFVPEHLMGSSAAPDIARLAPQRLAGLCDQVGRALAPYVTERGVELPEEVYIATASAA